MVQPSENHDHWGLTTKHIVSDPPLRAKSTGRSVLTIYHQTPCVTYTSACESIVNTIMTNEHTSLEKIYLYSKGLRKGYVWEVSWGLNRDCNILTPSSFVFSSTSFSFCWAAQSGIPRAHIPLLGAGSLYSILSPTDSKLTEPVCGPGLYNCLTSTCFLWASNLHPIQPSTVKVILWYLRPDAPVPWSTAGSEVNMLHIQTFSGGHCNRVCLNHIGFFSNDYGSRQRGLPISLSLFTKPRHYIYIYIYIYTNSSPQEGRKTISWAEIIRFKLRIFLLLDWLIY